MSQKTVLFAETLFDGIKKDENCSIVLEGDKIIDITKNKNRNARILGIDGILGTIETGKLASLVVWDQNPLHLAAFPKQIFAEGRMVRGGPKQV
ncbi:MAG: amidohydrolase family protein [Deltaproteobacteria bacterium]|nr:amidohydrolase family protein [Deltaproteobacteria bacterium]